MHKIIISALCYNEIYEDQHLSTNNIIQNRITITLHHNVTTKHYQQFSTNNNTQNTITSALCYNTFYQHQLLSTNNIMHNTITLHCNTIQRHYLHNNSIIQNKIIITLHYNTITTAQTIQLTI